MPPYNEAVIVEVRPGAKLTPTHETTEAARQVGIEPERCVCEQ